MEAASSNPTELTKQHCLAGLHALAFRFISKKNMPKWDALSSTPIAAKIAGLTSLALWIGVVAAGRWIGFI